LDEFNSLVGQDISLTSAESNQLSNIVASIYEQKQLHAVFPAPVFLVIHKLLKWNLEFLFPTLDLCRLLVLHEDFARQLSTNENASIISAILQQLKANSPVVNQMLSLRFVANMFRCPSLNPIIISGQEQILELAVDCTPSGNKNTRLALAAVVLNFSILYCSKKNQEVKVQCLSILCEILSCELENEVIYRCLVAVGNLIFNDLECLKLTEDLDVVKVVQACSSSSLDKIKECAADILKLIKSLKS